MLKKFVARLVKASTEEDVKAAYVKEWNLEVSTKDNNDLNTENVLFEFKLDRKLSERPALAKTFAQALYYVRRISLGGIYKVPSNLVVADINEAAIYSTAKYKELYLSSDFDWTRQPSSPDPRLTWAVLQAGLPSVLDVTTEAGYATFDSLLRTALSEISSEKLVITGDNFEQVFSRWSKSIGRHISSQLQLSFHFMSDLQCASSINPMKGTVSFGQGEEHHIPVEDYQEFWALYDRPPNAAHLLEITTKQDRINNLDKRRYEGEFYTPLRFAAKALDTLDQVLGTGWESRPNIRIWDPACGTGNLEYQLPSYDNCYMSTLGAAEVSEMLDHQTFPGATIFQYDYLNDDIALVFSGADLLDDNLGWKLPRRLREDLANPTIQWIILMNPPFGEGGSGAGTAQKAGISGTLAKASMTQAGKAGNELFVQFLYRVMKEVPRPILGLFATLKYVNAPNFKEFRHNVFHMKSRGGFIFHARNFQGTKGQWPVSFVVWEPNSGEPEHKVELDILNDQVEKVGVKTITPVELLLNSWFDKPRNTTPALALRSALIPNLTPALGKLSDKALGFCSGRDDLQHQNLTFFVSGVFGDGHGTSVTPDNFDHAITTAAVRLLPKHTWYNDRDQFTIPSPDPLLTRDGAAQDFIDGCLFWLLFSGPNQTSSMKDVEYAGKTWQLRNAFFPFAPEKMLSWDIRNTGIYTQLRAAKSTPVYYRVNDAVERLSKRDSKNHSIRLSSTAESESEVSQATLELFSAAQLVYQLYFKEYNNLDVKKWKLDYWDVGWYQVRNALKDKGKGISELEEVKKASEKLRALLLPSVYSYGFLTPEVVFD